MKNLTIAVLAAVALAATAYCSCVGPYCWDESGGSMTGVTSNKSHPVILSSSAINGLTPSIGDMVVCNTCTKSPSGYEVCIATSTTQPAFVTVSSTSKVCN